LPKSLERSWKSGKFRLPLGSKIKCMTKQATVELLKKQLPGFYSVQQVIEMIEKIEEVDPMQQPSLSADHVEDLIELIRGKVVNRLSNLDPDDVFENHTAEFSLSGNEIMLDSVDVSYDYVADEVMDVIEDVVHDFFPAPKEEV